MVKQLAKALQQKVSGEVFDSADALEYFSSDGSIFEAKPQVVVYPRDTDDVQAVVATIFEMAARGKKVNLTARGKGTDQAGAAISDGVLMVFPAHMNRLLKMDKHGIVTVQPGLIYKDLQNTLHTHHRFLPPYPSSIDFCTIGGAVANNACGEKTVKYGATRDFVKGLKVVLSNGQLIETRRLSSRELHKKKGQADFEGDIYRQLDELLVQNTELIKKAPPHVTKNSAGYALWNVRGPGGSFDLTQLMVGSQGTLGVVTEATIATLPYNPRTTLVVGYFDDLEAAGEAVLKIGPLGPSALEVVDYYLLDFLKKNRPAQIEGLVPDDLPKIVLLVEFDDQSSLKQKLKSSKVERVFKKLASSHRVSTKPKEQEQLWKIRRSAAAVIWMSHGSKKALPIIEDGVVPVAKLPEFLDKTYKLLKKHKLEIAVWGHAGNANFHMQPVMDLSKAKDRETVFKLADEFYDMVIKMGGSTCGEHNDGLMRAPYLKKLYGEEIYELFRQVKQIFDPQGILNADKKLDVTQDYLKTLVRKEYSMKHLYDHMPHN
jgi:FAD/FMN-containing dehydrogenase